MLRRRAHVLACLLLHTPFVVATQVSPAPSEPAFSEYVVSPYPTSAAPALPVSNRLSDQPASEKSTTSRFSLTPSSWILLGIGASMLFTSGSDGSSDDGGADTLPVVPRGIEYNADYAHAMIGTRTAHDSGWLGSGVNVAVLDTGFMANHPDLTGQFSSLYNAVSNLSGAQQVPDPDGHGTGVAGLLAAVQNGAGVVGVASGAKLIGVGFAEANGQLSQSDSVAARAFNYALDQQAAIINNSWGTGVAVDHYSGAQYASESPLLLSALRRAAAQGVVNVFPTGNNAPARIQPNLEAGLPLLFPELQAHWVAVTAVGSDGLLASYAQRCGIASAWCLAAPGGDDDQGVFEGLITPFNDGGYVSTIGTSEAAPLVSGALAVLKQRFPNLSNAQLVQRLFETADKRGIYSEALVYGQGLLDIVAATNPLGSLSLVTQGTDGNVHVVAGLAASSIELAPSLSRLGASLSGLQVGAVDRQGALFTVPMQDLMTAPSRSDHWAQRLHAQHLPDSTAPVPMGHDTRLWFFGNTSEQGTGLAVEHKLANVKLQLGLIEGLPVSEYDVSQSWSAQPVPPSRIAMQDTLTNPYYLTDERQIHLRVVQQPDDGYQIGLELASGQDAGSGQIKINSFLDYRLAQNISLRIEGGMQHEKGSLFGSRFEGAFNADTSMTTGYTGASVGWQISPADHVQVSYYIGRTNSSNSSGASLLHLDNISSRSLAAAWQHRLTSGTVVGVAIAEPLQIRAGEWSLNTATGYEQGQIQWQTQQGELGHSRLHEQEVFIQSPVNAGSRVKLSLMHQRMQQNSDVALLMSLRQRF